MDRRRLATRLQLPESGQYGLRRAFHGEDPVERAMEGDYFQPVRGILQAGDEIRVCQVIDKRVVALADLLVVEIRPNAVETLLLGDIVRVPASRLPAPRPTPSREAEDYVRVECDRRWNPGRQLFEIVDPDGNVICAVRDKDHAIAIAGGHVPIPNEALEEAA